MTNKIKLTPARIQAAACPSDKADITLWDADALGLGLRLYRGGQKSWWFQFRIDGKAARIRIGDADTKTGWPVGRAREEARRLKVLIDKGEDPRQERKEKTDQRAARKAQEEKDSLTLGQGWQEYVKEYRSGWSEEHLRDHQKMMVEPGLTRPRSKLKTVAGPLWSLRDKRIVDLPGLIPDWAKSQQHRATGAKKALRLLKAFLMHHDIRLVDSLTIAEKKKLARALPKTPIKKVSLTTSQLQAWWAGTLLLPPTTSVYLRFQLLTGARPGEGATLDWNKIDLRWGTANIKDKTNKERVIPLTPYVLKMLDELREYGRVIEMKREERGYAPVQRKADTGDKAPDYVFKAQTGSGPLTNADKSHNRVLAYAGIRSDMNLHGLRKTFLTLWDAAELPTGAGKQISGHTLSGDIGEAHYIDRHMDTLRALLTRYEDWILNKADADTKAPAITNLTRKTLLPAVATIPTDTQNVHVLQAVK